MIVEQETHWRDENVGETEHLHDDEIDIIMMIPERAIFGSHHRERSSITPNHFQQLPQSESIHHDHHPQQSEDELSPEASIVVSTAATTDASATINATTTTSTTNMIPPKRKRRDSASWIKKSTSSSCSTQDGFGEPQSILLDLYLLHYLVYSI